MLLLFFYGSRHLLRLYGAMMCKFFQTKLGPDNRGKPLPDGGSGPSSPPYPHLWTVTCVMHDLFGLHLSYLLSEDEGGVQRWG